MYNERNLLESLKQKENKAFEFVYNLFKNRVYSTAISYTQNKYDAEEVMQDVFVEVFKSAESFNGESSLSTWIFKITVNRSLDLIKYKKRKKRFVNLLSLWKPDSMSPIIDPPDFIHPGVELEQRENSKFLFKAIDRLPANQKSAFILIKIQGLSYLDAAAVLTCSVASIEALVHRANANLRKSLSGLYDEDKQGVVIS